MKHDWQKYYKQRYKKILEQLEPYFSEETCLGEFDPECPSRGHCAVVAAIVNSNGVGYFVSTKINGESHWYSKVYLMEQWWFLDLTGDQFGYPKVQISKAPLYEGTRIREDEELNEETRKRARLLAERAGFDIDY